jgi:antitoxin VapB
VMVEHAMPKARLFSTGGSQAVHCRPLSALRGDEVDIRRDPVTGDVVLSKPMTSCNEYFDWVRTLDLPATFRGARSAEGRPARGAEAQMLLISTT